MKKILALVMAAILLVSMAVSVSAATKADLLAAAAKSPVYKYVKVSLENAARTVEITDEEATAILPWVEKAVAIIGADKGPTAANESFIYSKEQIDGVLGCVDEICKILNYSYTLTPSTNPKHVGDSIFTVYNEAGKIVFQYDGDIVADTAAATEIDTTLMALGAVTLLGLGAAAVAVSKKRLLAE